MVALGARQNWTGTLRLALALIGLPFATCKSTIGALHSVTPGVCHIYTTCSRAMSSSPSPHRKSRCSPYPGSTIKRFSVPDDKVDWSTEWPQYMPVNYTAPSVAKNPPWADPEIGAFLPKFNTLDGAVDRTSFGGSYRVQQDRPLNPGGRTGLAGRGLLGRWGPNHAADPIITRWKVGKDGKKVIHQASKLPVLQFVSIKRKDCGEWAIPGGMVDPGEAVSATLQREFSEEALNSLGASPSDTAELQGRITKLFKSQGLQVYKGYVDDPRNTDNAWIETVAVNFHDDTGDSVSELPLEAGDDAGKVQWANLDSAFPLYASHSTFLEAVARHRHAHW